MGSFDASRDRAQTTRSWWGHLGLAALAAAALATAACSDSKTGEQTDEGTGIDAAIDIGVDTGSGDVAVVDTGADVPVVTDQGTDPGADPGPVDVGPADAGADVLADAADVAEDAGFPDGGGSGDSGVTDLGPTDAGSTDTGPDPVWDPTCSYCHGSEANPAPPMDLAGNTDETAEKVGAHQRHLGTSAWHKEILCSDCHVVPTALTDPGHVDSALPAELTWSALPLSDGASPVWDGTSCSSTYCHGNTLFEGGAEPTWTDVDNGAGSCGTCHGLPPASPHVQSSVCSTCHPTIADDLSFPDPERHIDGVLDVIPLSCTSCHGDTNPAPPMDLQGGTDTTATGVGAHQSHLGASNWHKEVLCADCHVVPTALGDPGHTDTAAPAELTWGALATTDGATPAWDGTSCATSYCHGNTLAEGGALPTWTAVGSGEAACGTCHGAPPASPHPQNGACSTCHPTIAADMGFPDPSRHIDGVLDLSVLSCSSCHGDTNPAPPTDTVGNTETTITGVGAHQSHVLASDWHKTIACDECHLLPSSIDAPGHVDTPLPAELIWGTLANADGADTAWDGASCASNYCHGTTLGDGGAVPNWTSVGASEAACGTCHGMPPAAPHTPNAACEQCHPTMGPGLTFISPELHVDGFVDVKGPGCTDCHGSGTNPAPPSDLSGGTDPSSPGVGAHTSHMTDSTWRAPIPCESCHVVPTDVNDPGHIDTAGPVEITWAGVSDADGANPNYDGTSCSSTYCHGTTLGDGGTTPDWTDVGTGAGDCGTCHGLPPGGAHPPNAACGTCHPDADAAGNITEPSMHIDGKVDVVGLSCSSCHGSPTTNSAPPVDTVGNTATTITGVGAHQAHLGGSAWHKEISCTECHVVPPTVDAAGHMDTPLPAELTWGSIANADGADTAFSADSCASNYCHGTTLIDGGVAPVWTDVGSDQATCGSCHGLPPAAPHPPQTNCSACHPTVDAALVHVLPEQHIDGVVDLKAGGCTACHGSGTDPAPPTDLTGNTDPTAPGVGAHQSHLGASDWHGEIACTECHLVPTSLTDPGHIDTTLPAELTWGTLTNADGAVPTYDGTSCSGTYCHGSTLTDGGVDPTWTASGAGEADCGTCHGLPPSAPHTSQTNCSVCHPNIAPDNTFTDPDSHIDGVIDVNGLSCTSCHGSGSQSAPPVDTSGNTDTTVTGVGAHAQHLGASGWHATIACTECHQVPAVVDAAGHIDTGLPAELIWGTLANADGANSAWAGGSCASNYCHGTTLIDGGVVPTWTDVGSGQANCGTCHGLPPAAPHTTATNCSLCHPNVDGSMAITDPSTHVNGVVDVTGQSCTSCHGSGTDPAPPTDLAGNSDPAAPGVGAHQSHLGTSTWRAAIACSACHLVPGAVSDAGHIDTALPAELIFGGISDADGASSLYDGTSCSSNYCHGTTLAEGGVTPAWTDVGTGVAACGTCHGNPPAAPHTPNTNCGTCHPDATVAGAISDPTRHIDGFLDVAAPSCTSCHGSGTDPAPPVDTLDHVATSFRGVGAHQSHLGASIWHKEITCTECHVVPTALNDPGHIDTDLPAELIWGPLADADGANSAFDGTSCSSNYCHGTTLIDGGVVPTWTTVGGSEAACGTCHGLPPAAPHTPDTNCATCHPTVDATLAFVQPDRHIDGNVDLKGLACTSCHGSGGNPAPPTDLSGSNQTSDSGVGAHRSHLGTSDWHTEITCDQCHLVPATVTAIGHIDTAQPAELTWGSLPSADGANPAFSGGNCNSVYCHGTTLGDGGVTPAWTDVGTGAADCGTCHGTPPAAPHTPNTNCETCHPSVNAGMAITDPSVHINGVVDVLSGCTGCHGTGTDPAPPVDTLDRTSTSITGVGAHQSHLGTSGWHKEVVCTDCHQVPATVNAVGHIDTALPAELVWSGTSVLDGAAPAFNGTTCSGTYCHGDTLAEGGTVPTWTSVGAGQADCGTCHGDPPAAPHVQRNDCDLCHPNIDGSKAFADPSTHIDGVVNLKSFGCVDCHGTGTDPAPPVDTNGSSNTNNRGVGAHQSHLGTSTWHAEISCTDCHIVPATWDAPGHLDGTPNAEVTWAGVGVADGATPSMTGTTCNGTYCHGATLIDGDASPSWTSVGAGQGDCGTCHGLPPGGAHPTLATCDLCHTNMNADQTTFKDPALHIDGVVQADYESNGGFDCSSCHGEIWERMNGTTTTNPAGQAIVSVHRLGNVAGLNDSFDPTSPGGTWANPLDATAPAARSCTNMCHNDHPHDQGASTTHENNLYRDARSNASRTAATPAMPTDFDGGLTTGGVCTSCHQHSVTTQGELHDPVDPNDYGGAAHDFELGGYTLHDGATVGRNCTKCHADGADGYPTDSTSPFGAAHWSNYDSLLRKSPIANNNTAAFLCYECHDAGGSVDIETALSRTYAHPVTADVDHDSHAERGAAWGDGTYWGGNRHVDCLDCHDPHQAGTVLHTTGTANTAIGANSPLKGASGVAWVQNGLGSWGNTTAGNFSPVDEVTYEYEICFKCHSTFAWGNSSPGTSPAPFNNTRTDVAKEFNPNNGRYHGVVGASKTTNGTFTNGWAAGDRVTCSDCHASNQGGDAAGPHGSGHDYLLKGTWTNTTGQSNNINGHLCFNCHSTSVYGRNCSNENASASGFSGDGDNLHCRRHDYMACSTCHGMVPHGWQRNYPLVVSTDPAPYRYTGSQTPLYSGNIGNWGPTNNWRKGDCSQSHNSCD